MEFAAAALSSLASAGSAAMSSVGSLFASGAAATTAGGIGSDAVAASTAGASGAAGSGLLSSLATPSTFGSILQGGAGLISAFAATRSAQSQAEGLYQQANAAEMDAAQQQIVATTKTNSLKSQLVSTLGQRDVAYGASGVDLSFGTPQVARAAAIQEAGDAIAATNDDATEQASTLRQRAALYRRFAGQAIDAGDVTAAGDVIGARAKILMRG